MYWPVFASAPESGRTAPILRVSGMFAAAFAVAAPLAVVPPVPPPPQAATTKAATSATAESFRMCFILPRVLGTRELCASVRLSLWTFAPVKSAVRPQAPDSRPSAVGPDHPYVGTPRVQASKRARRAERHRNGYRGGQTRGREAQERAVVAGDIG